MINKEQDSFEILNKKFTKYQKDTFEIYENQEPLYLTNNDKIVNNLNLYSINQKDLQRKIDLFKKYEDTKSFYSKFYANTKNEYDDLLNSSINNSFIRVKFIIFDKYNNDFKFYNDLSIINDVENKDLIIFNNKNEIYSYVEGKFKKYLLIQ